MIENSRYSIKPPKKLSPAAAEAEAACRAVVVVVVLWDAVGVKTGGSRVGGPELCV